MARKPTDKQLFKMKNEWLGQFYEEVKPKDFYRAVFPEGSFEREGHPEDEKCNGVLTVIEGEKARNYIVFDELNMIDEVKGAEFAIMSPVGYSGRNRTAKNARWLYGIAVDLVGIISVIVGVALKMNNNAIAIIGGADGPTSVFVAGKLNSVLVSILLIAIGVVMLIVAIIFYLKRKR